MEPGNLQEEGMGTGQLQGKLDLFVTKARSRSLLGEGFEQAARLVLGHQPKGHLGKDVEKG